MRRAARALLLRSALQCATVHGALGTHETYCATQAIWRNTANAPPPISIRGSPQLTATRARRERTPKCAVLSDLWTRSQCAARWMPAKDSGRRVTLVCAN